MYNQQRGMTMWGMAMVIALIVFFTLLGLKLFPPYMDNFKINTALQNVGRQPGAGSMTQEEISEALRKRLEIENVDNALDLRKALKIEARGRGGKVIRVVYEVKVPLAYNITALLDFDNSVEVRGVD